MGETEIAQMWVGDIFILMWAGLVSQHELCGLTVWLNVIWIWDARVTERNLLFLICDTAEKVSKLLMRIKHAIPKGFEAGFLKLWSKYTQD